MSLTSFKVNGYLCNIIDLNGILIFGVFFLAKPFPLNLAKAIDGKVALITHFKDNIAKKKQKQNTTIFDTKKEIMQINNKRAGKSIKPCLRK